MASRSSNRTAVPEAKAALDKFKYEVASELGVPLKEGYNGDLTSRQNRISWQVCRECCMWMIIITLAMCMAVLKKNGRA